MNKDLLDIYTDYLICQNKYATATGLSSLLDGQISHDKITRFLNSEKLDSKALWNFVKKDIRNIEQDKEGVLILGDSIEEKPYTDENEVVCWHFSLAKVLIGSILNFSRNEEITCKVIDDKYVMFEDQKKSLSAIASLLLQKMGWTATQVQGPLFWMYEGETLSERRERVEQEET